MLVALALAVVPLAACSHSDPAPADIPATVTLRTAEAPFGTYLTDTAGRALYMWDMDRTGSSKCYGDCAVDWPPLLVTDSAVAGDGVDANLIGESTRSNGTLQVTYGGWPLYYFAPDREPGQLTGQGDPGFGAVWWVVTPEGNPLPSS